LAKKSEDRLSAAIKMALADEQKVTLAEIVRVPDTQGIQIGADLSLENAREILDRKIKEENESQSFSSAIACFPLDGAWALSQALKELFGYVVSAKCSCGQNHNSDIEVVTDAQGTKISVPWGQFHVPGIEGEFSTGYTWQGKRITFQVEAYIKAKHAPKFRMLVKKVEEIVASNSLYRGKALNVEFNDPDTGRPHPIPMIRFVDVVDAQEPIFPQVLADQLEYDVMSYVTHADLVRPLNGGTLKRGVLLAGPYGCGKTLTAKYLADQATQRGWTFFYVNSPGEFYNAHLLARLFQPAIIFVEDVESIAGHERTEEVNRLLNVLDGTDSKMFDIMCVFTTNHGQRINEAMFRPGRMDITMRVTEPDAEAAVKLAVHYAAGRIEGGMDELKEAGLKLAGKIPATIQEAVGRARIRAVVRTGQEDSLITNKDLVAAAESIEQERTMFRKVDEAEVQKMGLRIGRNVLQETARTLPDLSALPAGGESNHTGEASGVLAPSTN
jgi:transitional endoplasmic reticulum ATPase